MADGGKVVIKVDADDKDFKNASKTWGKIGGTALKGIAVGAGAVTTAIGAIGTSAIKAYSDFEQLSGGMKKIFDEANISGIMADANSAFIDLGLSANQYLSVINDVGATFSATMGDQKGYDTARTGLKAISDYATGTGKNIDILSEKFTMITRSTSSYQSIADQFSGILPATSKDFLAQAQAVGLLDSSYTQLTQVPIAEYQQAVSEMLKKGVEDLGLANNTAMEATTTLSGSLGMLKSSWENLMIGMSDSSQNVDELLNNVVTSLKAVISNLLPRIQSLLPTIAQSITTLAPMLIEVITNLIPVLLPVIVQGIQSVADALIGAFPVIIDALLSNLPMIIETALQIVVALAMGIADSLPELIPTIVDTVLLIVETLIDNIDMLIDASIAIIMALADGLIKALPTLIEKVPEIVIKLVDAFVENAEKLAEASVALIISLGEGLIKSLPALIKNTPTILKALVKSFTANISIIFAVGKGIVEGIWKGISNGMSWIKEKLKGWVGNVTSFLKNLFGIHSPSTVMRDQVGIMLAKGMAVGIEKGLPSVENAVDNMSKAVTKKKWGVDFVSQVKNMIPNSMASLSASMGSVLGMPTFALAGGGTTNNYTTYNEQAPIKVESSINLDGRTLGRTTFDVLKQEMTRRGVTTIR